MAGSSTPWPVFLLAVPTWTISLVSDFAVANLTFQCPPGFVPQPHQRKSNRNFSSNPECVCGEWELGLVQCDEKTLEAFLPMRGVWHDIESAELFVGRCFYTLFRHDLHQFTLQLPSNITNLNEFVCGPFGREGRLCGQCKPGFGTSLYEKDLRCVNCTDTPLPGVLHTYLLRLYHQLYSSLSFWCWASQLPQRIHLLQSNVLLAGTFSVGLEYCDFKRRFWFCFSFRRNT